jgi:hypothetical protein
LPGANNDDYTVLFLLNETAAKKEKYCCAENENKTAVRKRNSGFVNNAGNHQ